MPNSNQDHTIKNASKSEQRLFEVADMGNYTYYEKYGCLLSEPKKFIGTLALYCIGFTLYYAVSVQYQHPFIIASIALTQVSALLMLIILAFKDPGIIPKVLPNF